MSKSQQDKINERLAQIKVWEQKRDEANQKLAELTGLLIKEPSVSSPLPQGFSMNTAIMEVFKENPTKKYKIIEMKEAIKRKFNADVKRLAVQNALRYLAVNKGLLEKLPEERGVFALKRQS